MYLIDQVKRKLNITWSDEDTDSRIADIIAAAEPILKHKLGIPAAATFDFTMPGIERNLFLAYCLYEWNHSANEFDENYHNEIAQCRAMHEVAAFGEREADAET